MIEDNMNTAPKDGTRILAVCNEWHFSNARDWHIAGVVIKEIWWKQFSKHEPARWCLWCGTEKTQSTDHVDPIRWMPIPTELVAR